jgi:phenylalanyl-tRNA synthetase alpha subunit
MLHQLKDLDPDQRRQVGALLNDVKGEFEKAYELRQSELKRRVLEEELKNTPPIDITLPFEVRLGLSKELGGKISIFCEHIPLLNLFGHLVLCVGRKK